MRDAYGNRMLDDFSAQLWYHIVDANCDPRDPYDPLCVPVDQVTGGFSLCGFSMKKLEGWLH